MPCRRPRCRWADGYHGQATQADGDRYVHLGHQLTTVYRPVHQHRLRRVPDHCMGSIPRATIFTVDPSSMELGLVV